MLTVASVVLYGGFVYYLAIAQKWDLAAWFYRFKLDFVVTTWQRGPEGRVIVLVGFIAFLLIIEAAVVGFGGGAEGPEPPARGEWMLRGENMVVTGYTAEGSSDEAFPDLDHLNLVAANLTLAWNDNDVDEPGPGVTPLSPKNQPDSFRLTVRLPDGTEYTGQGTSAADSRLGEIRVSVPRPAEGNITGWVIEVECTDSGDVVGLLGRTWATDGGNDWALRIEYEFLEWVSADST